MQYATRCDNASGLKSVNTAMLVGQVFSIAVTGRAPIENNISGVQLPWAVYHVLEHLLIGFVELAISASLARQQQDVLQTGRPKLDMSNNYDRIRSVSHHCAG
jgi:hypothetical protein